MISGNYYLTRSQTEENAREFYNFMLNNGFNVYSVCAMLGNIQVESGVNPGIWENLNYGNLNGGYGLVQWTPATKILNWLENNNFDQESGQGQMERIIWEKDNGEQWSATSDYPLSFSQFAGYSNSSMTDEEICKYLANAFLRNYERPKNQNQPQRGVNAWEWFKFFGAVGPVNPEPGEPVEPDQPIEGPKFDIVYVIGNDQLMCVGNEFLIISVYQCVYLNDGVNLKLRVEVDPTESLFQSVGQSVYKRIEISNEK